jgi:23S rRNA pseudouridine955/2504/2580 synthase
MDKITINVPLLKQQECVVVSQEGKTACTHVKVLRRVGEYTLVEAQLMTGRTHQLRVHLSHVGHPIVGDDRYGDLTVNKHAASHGLRRLCLHAWRLSFIHNGHRMFFEAVPDACFGVTETQ